MAISHVCLNCGADLARVRAALEPFYRLPLVRCPSCAAVAVRRRHPIIARCRRGRRAARAITLLGLQLFAAWAILAVLAGSVGGLADAMDAERLSLVEAAGAIWAGEPSLSQSRSALHGDRGVFLAAGLIGAAFISGAWLTATMRHACPHRLAIYWPLALLIAISMDILLWLPVAGAFAAVGDPLIYRGPDLSEWLTRVLLLGPAVAATLVGLFAGVGARRADDARRRRAFRRLLQRRRRARRDG